MASSTDSNTARWKRAPRAQRCDQGIPEPSRTDVRRRHHLAQTVRGTSGGTFCTSRITYLATTQSSQIHYLSELNHVQQAEILSYPGRTAHFRSWRVVEVAAVLGQCAGVSFVRRGQGQFGMDYGLEIGGTVEILGS